MKDDERQLAEHMKYWQKQPRHGLAVVQHESDVVELTADHRLNYRLIRGLSMLAQENR